MNFFSDSLNRLKPLLRVSKDQEVAAALGLSKTAFSERKKRGSFPDRELRELARQRPDLGIDVDYVLTGHMRADYEALTTSAERAPLINQEERMAGVFSALSPSSKKVVLQLSMRLRELEVLAVDGRPPVLSEAYPPRVESAPVYTHDAPLKASKKAP